MVDSIVFPNLGIELNNVGSSISIFGFEIAYYGMVIGLGILAGVWIATSEAKRTGQNPDHYYDMAMYGVVSSIIGARLYYVAFSWESYKDDLLSIFNIRQGGLAIYGGVIAAVITVFIFAKIKKLSPLQILDTVGLGLIIGQAIGRWGNFFNREAFGEYTDSLFAMRLPLDAVRSGDVTQLMLDNIEYIDEVAFIQVHPTFFYESIWNLGVLILLLFYRKHKKFQGELFLLYLAGYGAGRFWIEGLRTDQLQLANGIAVSQMLAGMLMVCATVAIIVIRKYNKKKSENKEEKGAC
ncbi:MAG: prolipoprotein diacylglyceryl transferase [Eubacteriales bacterium]